MWLSQRRSSHLQAQAKADRPPMTYVVPASLAPPLPQTADSPRPSAFSLRPSPASSACPRQNPTSTTHAHPKADSARTSTLSLLAPRRHLSLNPNLGPPSDGYRCARLVHDLPNSWPATERAERHRPSLLLLLPYILQFHHQYSKRSNPHIAKLPPSTCGQPPPIEHIPTTNHNQRSALPVLRKK